MINPQRTDSDGRYGWDVSAGCWYIAVSAEGYETQVSPLAAGRRHPRLAPRTVRLVRTAEPLTPLRGRFFGLPRGLRAARVASPACSRPRRAEPKGSLARTGYHSHSQPVFHFSPS